MKRIFNRFILLAFILFLAACAQPDPTLNVTYLDFDGRVIASYEVVSGDDAPVPDAPIREGYVFEGFSPSHLNITQDTEIVAVYSIIEEPLYPEPVVFVLTHLEGLETLLEGFLEGPFEIVRTIEDIVFESAVRLLVLYEDGLRRLVHPSRLGGPTIQPGFYVTFSHQEDVDITMVYLDDVAAFETFFQNIDETLFEITSPRLVYELYPLVGVTVYDASSLFEAQLLVDAFDGEARLARRTDDLTWLYTSETIVIFLGTSIPSFLSPYQSELSTLENEAMTITNPRGQRFIIGRSTGDLAPLYYEAFVATVNEGFATRTAIRLLPPEGFTYPQPRLIASDMCYLIDVRGPYSRKNETTISHQIPSKRVSSLGTAVGLSVMIGFNEIDPVVSDQKYRSMIENANQVTSEFYDLMSDGKFQLDWIIHPEVVYVPFFITPDLQPDNPDYERLINEHIMLVLSYVEETTDLTDVELINFFWPIGLPDYVYGGLSAMPSERMNTERGNIYNYSVKKVEARYIDDPKTFARNLYHGAAHNLGLSDLYIQQWVPEFAGKPRTYKYGHWDMMTSADNELNGWHRWILQWVEDRQVHCIPPTTGEEYQVFLEPLNHADGDTRLIVIPLSESQAISIELRGPGRFCPEEPWRSFSIGPNFQGGCTQDVLVTLMDTSMGNGHGPMQILRPSRSTSDDYSDALLLEGEFVQFGNIIITHSEKFALGSVITIRFD